MLCKDRYYMESGQYLKKGIKRSSRTGLTGLTSLTSLTSRTCLTSLTSLISLITQALPSPTTALPPPATPPFRLVYPRH